MQPALLYALVLVPLSLLGYGWLVRRIARRGGAVPKCFGPPDLALALVLTGFFGMVSWLTFHLPQPEIRTLSIQQIWRGEIPTMVLVLGVFCFLAVRGISLREAFGLRACPLALGLVFSLGLMLLAYPAVAMVSAVVASRLPRVDIEEQLILSFFRSEVRQHHYAGIVSLVFTAVVLAPAMEETLFRGYLYPVFKRYLTGVGSALFTAALFGLLHGNVAALAGLFALALCLIVAYEWSGSLLVPMGMHAIFNGVTLIVVYFGADAALK